MNVMNNNRLISIAGIHVFSTKYNVSALGNITTLPEFRGKGYGKMVSARLCKSLIEEGITDIGLNVKKDNIAAISSYERIGFRKTSVYNEFLVNKIIRGNEK